MPRLPRLAGHRRSGCHHLQVGYTIIYSHKPLQYYISVLRYQARVRCNGHQVDRVVARQGSSQVELESLGSGLFPVLPLLNHSCDQNTIRVFTNNRVLLLVARSDHSPSCLSLVLTSHCREIEAGEEVTDSYGLTFIETTQQQRQRRFRSQYKFTCQCVACLENFPTFDKLEKGVGDNLAKLIARNLKLINDDLAAGKPAGALKNAISFRRLLRCLPHLHAVNQRNLILIQTCLRMLYSGPVN